MSWFSKGKRHWRNYEMFSCMQPWSKHVQKPEKPARPVRQRLTLLKSCILPGSKTSSSRFLRLNNRRWKNKITCIYTEQDLKAHKLSFTHPLNARKGKENVQWKDNEKLGMAALLLMKNTTNKQKTTRRRTTWEWSLQSACAFVACTITECSKNTGQRPIVMCLRAATRICLRPLSPFYVVDIRGALQLMQTSPTCQATYN